MVICCKRLFCGNHFFVISIYNDEFHFNDSVNERYHLLIHYKQLEQLKTFGDEKLLPLMSSQNTKNSIKYCYHWGRKINKSDRSIFRESYGFYQWTINVTFLCKKIFCRWWWYTSSHKQIWIGILIVLFPEVILFIVLLF